MSNPRPVPRGRTIRLPNVRNSSSLRNSPAPRPQKQVNDRTCPHCHSTNIGENNDGLVCFSCAAIISDSVIVNDVTFGEAPSGAALVQGTTVHDGQRVARSSGTAFRRGGRTPEDAQDTSSRLAKEEMTRLAQGLLVQKLVDRAFHLYTLGRIHNFHRPVLESVAICLYITCRQTKEPVLLIDIAEKIKQNVFDLGAVYKKFIRDIGLEEDLRQIPLIEIEPVIHKFARRLEFGPATKQVASDAVSILARMDRDWMVTGRQPAAICGAALILAARMNNFRRTLREVVFVVKAGDQTIMRRLEEFRRTKAGRLTVMQFRQYGKRLKDTAEPPAIYRARELEERKRKRLEDQSISISVSPDNTTPESLDQRVDEDGFAVPTVPGPRTNRRITRVQELSRNVRDLGLPTPTPSQESEGSQNGSTTRRKRGRPRKDNVESQPEQVSVEDVTTDDVEHDESHKKRKRRKVTPEPVTITEEDLIAEEQLEQEISSIVRQRLDSDEHFSVIVARSRAIATSERAREKTRDNIPEGAIIGEDEFEDDPEVSNCLLSQEEIEVKEKIWVTHNHDWLRRQQELMLDRAMQEAMGKKKRMKKSSKNASAHDTPASTPAEATHRLIEKKTQRHAFSKHINYEKLKQIYGIADIDETNGKSDDEESQKPDIETAVEKEEEVPKDEEANLGASEDEDEDEEEPFDDDDEDAPQFYDEEEQFEDDGGELDIDVMAVEGRFLDDYEE